MYGFLSCGGACKHLRASILWVNWLQSQPPYPKYYQTLEHQKLPYVFLPTQEDAIKKLEMYQSKSLEADNQNKNGK